MRKLFLLSVLVAGCSIKPTKEPTFYTSQAGSFSAEIIPNEEPNSYSVRLRWKAVESGQGIAIKRSDEDSRQAMQLDIIGSDSTDYLDSTAVGGTRYQYRLAFMKDGTVTEGDSVLVQVPKDLAVNSSGVLKSIGPEISRVFLGNGVRLATLSRDTTIEVDEIIADDAIIDTSSEKSIAEFNTAGLSGGVIQIKARSARGKLTILATGQQGGEGQRGAQGGAGAMGGRGRNGKDGSTQDCVTSVNQESSNGFALASYQIAGDHHGHCFTSYYCAQETGNGGQGSRGQSGGSGIPGLPGGDSAKVLVSIENPSQFEVKPVVSVGTGGVGGLGGIGGGGGPGGDPGNPSAHCKKAGRGAQGPKGSEGPRGLTGLSGKSQPICLKLGSAQFGDCAEFK